MADHVYKEFPYAFTSKGLSARLAIDKVPLTMYWNLLGVEVRQENALSSRLGRIPITVNGNTPVPLLDLNIHTLSRLKSVGATYRYAGAGQNIYRRTGDTPGAYSNVNGGTLLSGNRFSSATYRPNFSSFPYIFFADSKAMLKDIGTFTPLQQMGIFPPVIPPTLQIAGILETEIDLFFEDSANPVKTFVGISSSINVTIQSVIRTAGVVTVTTIGAHGIQPFPGTNSGGGRKVTVSGVSNGSFNGNFALTAVPSPTTFQYVQNLSNATGLGGAATCLFPTLKVNTTVPAITGGKLNTVTPASMTNIQSNMSIEVDSGGSAETVFVISTTGTTFTAFFSNSHSNGTPIFSTGMSGSILASTTASVVGQGPFNLDVIAGSSPANDADLITFFFNLSNATDVSSLTLLFDVGDGTFTHDFYSTVVPLGSYTSGTWANFSITRGSFSKNGNAGLPGQTWANVNSYKIQVITNAGGGTTFQMGDLYLFNATGPSVAPAGQPFDYRYTYFNINTGLESNPSVPMVAAGFVSPNNQTVIVTLTPSLDPQVTHIRIYRRGGTLNTGWTFVDQIPANSTSYLDGFTDTQIASNSLLQLDNDPPLTTTLRVPVNTFLGTNVLGGSTQTVTPPSMVNIFKNQQITIDTGNNQEIVIVQAVTATTFTAYFQNAHGAGASISAFTRSGNTVNLMTIAFDKAWLAGDQDNPNRLYYSKTTNPEAFPPQNWIEIGTPSDPIMAIVFFRSQIFVFTQARVHRVIIPFPGAVPAPYPTSSRHGLYANFGFCIAERVLPYLSKDGGYIFQGDASDYATEVIEWLFADKEPNLSPVPEQDPKQAQNSIAAFTKNEFYLSYLDKNAIQRRVSYDFKNSRWRNDDVPATAMFFEEDTEELVIARNNGMIYLDRRNDMDGEGSSNQAININLQTGAQDQQLPLNNKSYNELTLDVDTSGQSLDVALIFDNGTTVLDLGSFSSNGRSRIPFAINDGDGQLSQNVSLQITGAVTKVVHFYNWHIKAAVDAEFRLSFDSFWSKFGTDEFKFVKQGWFEYMAPDPNGIFFNVYIEGVLDPIYTFQLSKATVRTAKWLRFPAIKAKIWRVVGTSGSPFQLYGESFIEFKPVTTGKGYEKQKLGAITAQGSV